MKRLFARLRSHFREKQYYYVCGVITAALLALGFFRFPNAIGRLVEAFRDFGSSLICAFCKLFDIETELSATVNTLPDYSFLNVKEYVYSLFGATPKNTYLPSLPFPDTWAEFKAEWVAYWQAFATSRNFFLYLYHTTNFLYVTWIVLALGVPLFFLVRALFKKFYFREKPIKKAKNGETETDEAPPPGAPVEREITDSKPLILWHKLYFGVILRVEVWFAGLFDFIKEHDNIWGFWLLLASLYFNFFTIFFETLAYYVYVLYSVNITTIYKQIYKLFLDLWSLFSFMPLVGWIAFFVVILETSARRIGYNNLYHRERCNRGFGNELGVITYIYAEVGGFKTTMLTDMLLSDEVQLRDDALEIILECDACFPNFPWLRLERALKRAYEAHEVYDKWSCIRWVQALRKRFEETSCAANIFEYDIEHYPLEYDNKLYLEYIWDTIEDYALAYTIYTIQNSLLITNFSVRVDNLFMDLGNFPLWDSDFFKRDSRYLEAYSRHSNILDFDMLRIGSQMLKDNPNRYAFGWGVYGVTEADKEFKNTLELEEIKAKDEECNQKNDLTHVSLKMSRHACMIRGRNMLRAKMDMQRVENITANLRQIGQVALIAEKGDKTTVLPYFAPYRVLAPVLLTVKEKLDNLFINNRFLRSDNRLITNGIDKLRSLIGKWNERYMNVFGSRTLDIELQSGRMDGKVRNY